MYLIEVETAIGQREPFTWQMASAHQLGEYFPERLRSDHGVISFESELEALFYRSLVSSSVRKPLIIWIQEGLLDEYLEETEAANRVGKEILKCLLAGKKQEISINEERHTRGKTNDQRPSLHRAGTEVNVTGCL